MEDGKDGEYIVNQQRDTCIKLFAIFYWQSKGAIFIHETQTIYPCLLMSPISSFYQVDIRLKRGFVMGFQWLMVILEF